MSKRDNIASHKTITQGALRREARIGEIIDLIPHHSGHEGALRGSIRLLIVDLIARLAKPELAAHWGIGEYAPRR